MRGTIITALQAYGNGYDETNLQTAIMLLETVSIIKRFKQGRYTYLEIINHVAELEIIRLQQEMQCFSLFNMTDRTFP
jgi:hypothetical protein